MKIMLLSAALASSLLLSGCVVSVGGGSDSHYGADWEDRGLRKAFQSNRKQGQYKEGEW